MIPARRIVLTLPALAVRGTRGPSTREPGRPIKRSRSARTASFVVLAAVLVPNGWLPQAQATFPGENGKIAFTSGGARTQPGCSFGISLLDVQNLTVEPIRFVGRAATRPRAASCGAAPDWVSRGLRWSPDGRRLAAVWSSLAPSYLEVDETSGELHISAVALRHRSISWTRHGRLLLTGGRSRNRTSLWTARPDGSDLRRLLPGVIAGDAAEASPRGDVVAVLAGEILPETAVLPHRTAIALHPTGRREARLVVEAGGFRTGFGPIDWSPDGRSLVTTRWRELGRRTQLVLVDAATGRQRRLRIPLGPCTELSAWPSWSPDGRWIGVAAVNGCTSADPRVLLVDVATGSVRRSVPVPGLGGAGELAWQPRPHDPTPPLGTSGRP